MEHAKRANPRNASTISFGRDFKVRLPQQQGDADAGGGSPSSSTTARHDPQAHYKPHQPTSKAQIVTAVARSQRTGGEMANYSPASTWTNPRAKISCPEPTRSKGRAGKAVRDGNFFREACAAKGAWRDEDMPNANCLDKAAVDRTRGGSGVAFGWLFWGSFFCQGQSAVVRLISQSTKWMWPNLPWNRHRLAHSNYRYVAHLV